MKIKRDNIQFEINFYRPFPLLNQSAAVLDYYEKNITSYYCSVDGIAGWRSNCPQDE